MLQFVPWTKPAILGYRIAMLRDAKRSGRLYVLREPDMPWGDYGAILFSGMSGHSDRWGERIRLKRTGPFIPPLTQPGISEIVVTDGLKRQLQASRLTGLRFRPVQKTLIVRLNWEQWDLGADRPAQYPAGGEPENYILGRKHNEAVSRQMGSLWEIRLGTHARHVKLKRRRGWSKASLGIDYSTWDGTDFFRADRGGYTFVSERAKAWLQNEIDPWVRFEPAIRR